MARRTPTKGSQLGIYQRNMTEFQRLKGLRSKLSPKEPRQGLNLELGANSAILL